MSVRCGSGLPGRPASESGRLCRGARAQGRGDRRRRTLVLAILSNLFSLTEAGALA
jgi:hypothetical protein